MSVLLLRQTVLLISNRVISEANRIGINILEDKTIMTRKHSIASDNYNTSNTHTHKLIKH